VTDELDLEDVVDCPHCGGVLSGPWEEHRTSALLTVTVTAVESAMPPWISSP
jgi:hypothetical protein